MYFGCHANLQEKIVKYTPLVTAFSSLWGRMELVSVPVGHTGTTLNKTH
jgi:hypothetical protein